MQSVAENDDPRHRGDHALSFLEMHFVVVRSAPYRTVPFRGRGGLPTTCPLMQQVGEDCGFTHERIEISDIAKHIASTS